MNGNRSRTMAVVSALLAAAVAGCTDTVVEPKSTVTTTNVFTDENAYTQFIAKVYGGLALTGQQGPTNNPDIQGLDEGFAQYLRVWWQLNQLPTDETVVAWGDPDLPEVNTGQWDADNVWVYAMWSRIYFQVAMANEFLRQTADDVLDSRGVTASLRTTIQTYRAEARFLRALSYWHGIDMFGDIPLVTEADILGATPPLQVTRDSVYRYVVNEVTEIADDLPAAGASSYARATPAAAHMLLANLYLNAGIYTGTANYAGALSEAQAVIASGTYDLAPNYRNNFLADNHTSPEVIFSVPFDGLRTQTWGGATFLVHAACGGSMDNNLYGINGCWWGIRLKPQAYYRYQVSPPAPLTGEPAGDSRSAFFYDNGSVAVNNISTFTDGIAAPKYSNLTSGGAAGSDGTFPDTDFPMFRLADAYLIYIEAFLNGGGGTQQQALDYFNELRERAYGDTDGNITAGELTMQMLMDERGRELLWEGHRRTDLIRWGLFTTPSTYTWAWENNSAAGTAYPACRALFPKPTNELSANPNLSQNPGYGGGECG
jgi:hypothetical protein